MVAVMVFTILAIIFTIMVVFGIFYVRKKGYEPIYYWIGVLGLIVCFIGLCITFLFMAYHGIP